MQQLPCVRVVRPLRCSGEAERRARKMLHGAVVQVGGDAATLGVGCLERREQQALALALAGTSRRPSDSASGTCVSQRSSSPKRSAGTNVTQILWPLAETVLKRR